MKWLKAKRLYLKKRKKDKDTRAPRIPDPMKERFPYSYKYPYVFDSPYEDGGSKGFSNYSDVGSGGGIKMDPEKYIYKDKLVP